MGAAVAAVDAEADAAIRGSSETDIDSGVLGSMEGLKLAGKK